MSGNKREPKNATATFTGGSIDSLLKFNVNSDSNFEKEVNIAVDNDININVDAENVDNVDVNNRMELIKHKMKVNKRDSNRQVTVYLTPRNYIKYNELKEKGKKSELINELLDVYFEN